MHQLISPQKGSWQNFVTKIFKVIHQIKNALISILIELIFSPTAWWEVIIGSGNGLIVYRQPAITWINNDKDIIH